MQIYWNAKDHCFELNFDRSNFQDNLDKAKGAGFKTTGPPQWVWYTDKIKVLKKLRENKPAEGLTITDEARKEFDSRLIEEDKKEEVLKWARDQKARLAGLPTEDEKKAKREERERKRIDAGKGPIVRKPRQARSGGRVERVEVKYEPMAYNKFIPPPPPSILCLYCKDPVYEKYEKVDPLPICLWCEKTITDLQGEDDVQQ